MKLRSGVLGLLLLTAACASTSEPHAGSVEQDWVITPNGQADVATMTLALPEGFSVFDNESGFTKGPAAGLFTFPGCDGAAGAGVWTFDFNGVQLPVGTRTPVPSASGRLRATFNVCGKPAATAALDEVTPTPGFDTRVTFAVARISFPGRLRFASSVGIVYGFGMADVVVGLPKMRPSVDQDLYRHTTDSGGGLWLFQDRDVPIASGDHEVKFNAEPAALAPEAQRFTAVAGQRVTVTPAPGPPAPFRLRFTHPDPRTMPDAVPLDLTISCGESAKAPTPETTIFTVEPASCTLGLPALRTSEPVLAAPAGLREIALPRIEVDDVLLTDLVPPSKVRGRFTVKRNAGTTAGPFPTAHGVDVLPGHYTVVVAYENAAGEVKTLTFEKDL